MDHSYRYSYGKVRLFPLLHEYIEPLRRLRNTNRFCFVNQQEVSPEDQEQWYQNYLKKTNDIMFGIEKRLTWSESLWTWWLNYGSVNID